MTDVRQYLKAYESSHFCIEGKAIYSLLALFRECKERGYDGSMQNLKYRLERGAHTWTELSKPIFQKMSAARKENAARKKSEMHDICAELDARKKALAAEGEEE